MSGNEYQDRSRDDVRPRRKTPAAARPIGWRAANRILSGRDGGRGAEDLHALIAVASKSAQASPASSASSEPLTLADRALAEAEAEPAGREAMLTAFRASAADWENGGGQRRAGSGSSARKVARGRHTSRALVLRFTTAVLLVCGVGAAAASAGVLPEGVQRIARDYFGIGGVSAPSTHAPSPSTVTAGPTKGSGSTGSSAATPSPATSAAPASSDVIVALCQKIASEEGDWENGVDAAGQATLIAAAGGEHKVKGYCARLLAGSDKGAAPSPDATGTKGSAVVGTPPPASSVAPTVTHGKAHVSHSPDASPEAHDAS